jgi:methionyl-tRNA formyltransferase
MTVLFFGTAAFAVPALEAIAASSHTILAVVTQPDRPSGRGLELRGSPVSAAAGRLGLTTHKPERSRAPGFVEQVRGIAPDVLVVAAYGQILPQALLDIPRHGGINIHASLLPRWRGAAPIERAIQHGDAVTGVTIMQMDAGMDTGDILLQRETPIGPDETAGELAARLSPVGAEIIVDALDRLPQGLPRTPQDGAKATKAPMIKREEGRIDWSLPAQALYNLYRAFTPRPGVHFEHRARYVKALAVNLIKTSGVPGNVTGVSGEGIQVACGENGLLLTSVQPESKAPMPAAAFANGYGVKAGTNFTAAE